MIRLINKKQDIDMSSFKKDCERKTPTVVMAEKYDVSESTIKRIMKEEGIFKTKSILTLKMIEDAKVMHKNGKTFVEIRDEIKNKYNLYKLSVETISRKIRNQA